jgi:antitoxin (DNA-binding transcriptional repressor) of toxin-antitoxin stability system
MTNMAAHRTSQVNMAQAKARFSELVRRARAGVDVVNARLNKPIQRLVPLEPPRRARRVAGSARGRVRMAVDFDATPPDFGEYLR